MQCIDTLIFPILIVFFIRSALFEEERVAFTLHFYSPLVISIILIYLIKIGIIDRRLSQNFCAVHKKA